MDEQWNQVNSDGGLERWVAQDDRVNRWSNEIDGGNGAMEMMER